MKKSLFAVAAATAFAGAAQAQSSVTVYGVLDMGYIGSNVRAVDARSTTAANQVVKTTTSAFGQGAESTSRLGFRGTEDLGGGQSAFFTVELGLTPMDSNLSGSSATSAFDSIQGTSQAGGSAINNRQSFVGMRDKALGQFAFGRQYTPIYNEAAKTDPNAFANIVGGVIYVATPSQLGQNTGQQANIGFTNRASNALTISTPTMAGFNVNGFYAMNNTDATQRTSSFGGNSNWNGYGINANFTWQKLYATVAYQSFKTEVNGTILYGAPQSNLGSAVLAGVSATSSGTLNSYSMLSDKQTFAGATYDFGILKAYVQWIGRKVQQDNSSANGLVAAGEQMNRNAQAFGVRGNITKTIESWASIGNGKFKGSPLSATSASNTVNFTAYQVGTNYWMSKRTNMYAMFGSSQTSSSGGAAAGAGSSANQYALGLRHTF